jgi:cell division FtsZ-interacting protein ZapD
MHLPKKRRKKKKHGKNRKVAKVSSTLVITLNVNRQKIQIKKQKSSNKLF